MVRPCSGLFGFPHPTPTSMRPHLGYNFAKNVLLAHNVNTKTTTANNWRAYLQSWRYQVLLTLGMKILAMEFKSNWKIATEYLNGNKMFVYRSISRYNNTGSFIKRNNGWGKHTVTSPEMVRKVQIRIKRKPKANYDYKLPKIWIGQTRAFGVY